MFFLILLSLNHILTIGEKDTSTNQNLDTTYLVDTSSIIHHDVVPETPIAENIFNEVICNENLDFETLNSSKNISMNTSDTLQENDSVLHPTVGFECILEEEVPVSENPQGELLKKELICSIINDEIECIDNENISHKDAPVSQKSNEEPKKNEIFSSVVADEIKATEKVPNPHINVLEVQDISNQFSLLPNVLVEILNTLKEFSQYFSTDSRNKRPSENAEQKFLDISSESNTIPNLQEECDNNDFITSEEYVDASSGIENCKEDLTDRSVFRSAHSTCEESPINLRTNDASCEAENDMDCTEIEELNLGAINEPLNDENESSDFMDLPEPFIEQTLLEDESSFTFSNALDSDEKIDSKGKFIRSRKAFKNDDLVCDKISILERKLDNIHDKRNKEKKFFFFMYLFCYLNKALNNESELKRLTDMYVNVYIRTQFYSISFDGLDEAFVKFVIKKILDNFFSIQKKVFNPRTRIEAILSAYKDHLMVLNYEEDCIAKNINELSEMEEQSYLNCSFTFYDSATKCAVEVNIKYLVVKFIMRIIYESHLIILEEHSIQTFN